MGAAGLKKTITFAFELLPYEMTYTELQVTIIMIHSQEKSKFAGIKCVIRNDPSNHSHFELHKIIHPMNE